MRIDIYNNLAGRKFPAYYADAVLEYSKRLSPYLKINLHTGKFNNAVMRKNNARFVRISKTGAVFSSEGMAREIQYFCTRGISEFSFFFGFDDFEGDFHDMCLIGADISVPLQIVLLYEQIYRSIKIINNEPYHK